MASAATLVAATLNAQSTIPSANAKVRAALDMLKTDNAWTIQQQIELTQIPAPPFKETARGAEFKKRLEALGMKNVRVDAVGNVIAERKGVGTGPTVVIAGHLDTVFPEGTDTKVKREGDRLSAPGIGDDDRGLAVVLAVVRAFEKAGVQTLGTVYFIGNVGEEGPGNLRGMRHLFGTELKGKVDYFITVDDTGLGIASRAVGSNRYRVTYKGPGGHSYGAFGLVSPAFAMGAAIAQFSRVTVPANPKTTFNVGVVRGGTSVNSIPTEMSMDVDMRSESPDALNTVVAQFQAIIQKAVAEENAARSTTEGKIEAEVTLIGDRPSGETPVNSPLVQTATAVVKTFGLTPHYSISSTDSNVPISLGIPAVTIGRGPSERAHALDEWTDVEKSSPRFLACSALAIVLAAAQ